MFRRWFQPFTTQPLAVRIWAFILFIAYSAWSLALLTLPFGVDDRLHGTDVKIGIGVMAVFAVILALIGVRVALQTTAPATGETLSVGAWALPAYSLTAAATLAGMLWIAGTRTDLYKLVGWVVAVVFVVNIVLMAAWGRRPVDRWTAWGVLLLAGTLTAGAGWLGLISPVEIETTVNGVPVTITAPEGRLVTTCTPVIWDVGVPKDWEAYVRAGLDGGTLQRTTDAGTFNVCAYANAESTAPNPTRPAFEIPLTDGESAFYRVVLPLAVVSVNQMRLLVILGLLTAFLPPTIVLAGSKFTR